MGNSSAGGSRWTLAMTATTTALIVLSTLGTLFVRIPIPATTGYFNVGDVFVILAGLWLGPIPGLLVGAIGPAAADAIGYPQFILATAVTKGLEGFIVGLVGYGDRAHLLRKALAAALGGVTIIVGYFVFEAFVYPALGSIIPFFNVTTLEQALAEVLPNFGQAVIGAAVGFGLWRSVARFDPGSQAEEGESDTPT